DDARLSNGSWTSPRRLADVVGGPASADTSWDTNGAVVVYASTRNGEQDVYWQPVDGGPEGHVQLAGPDVEPNISGRLITFVHLDTSGPIAQTDIYGF